MLFRRLYIAFALFAFTLCIWELVTLGWWPHLLVSEPPYSTCRWPPVKVADIKSGNAFNLSICVRLVEDRQGNATPVKRYRLDELLNTYPTNETITFEDLVRFSEHILPKMRYPQVWKTYPQDVPYKEIVQDIKAGRPISYAPEYNFPLRLLASSESVCHEGSKHDLVIVVKNSVLGFDARREFRRHIRDQRRRYPRLNVGYVFSVGVPRNHSGRHFDRHGTPMNLNSPAGDQLEAFEGKADEVLKKIREEIEAHDDIVLADYEDTYYNLTLKTITNYRWMSAFCGSENVRLFMTIDDDHRVNLSMVEEFLKRVPETKRKYSEFGWVGRGDGAKRSPSSKMYLSRREVPWDKMATYLWGFAHLIGPGVVDDIAIASAFTKNDIALEDVYLGLIYQRFGIALIWESSMYPELFDPSYPPIMVAGKNFFKKCGLP